MMIIPWTSHALALLLPLAFAATYFLPVLLAFQKLTVSTSSFALYQELGEGFEHPLETVDALECGDRNVGAGCTSDLVQSPFQGSVVFLVHV